VVIVPLTADIGQGFPPGSEATRFTRSNLAWVPWIAVGYLLLYLLLLLLGHVH
jgi:hypothetical protein